MRTRLFVISLVMLMAIVPAEAKKKQINDIQNLSPAELEAKHDSIVYEGYRIYLKEMIAWTSEDMFFAKCSQQHMMQGSVISGIFPDFSDIFYNLDTRQCIYEVKTNVETNEVYGIDSVRPLADKELAKINLQERIYSALYTLDIDIQEPPEGCRFNFDWFPIDNNRFRVFGIMGCSTQNVIPWGNDFSYDCDSLGNVLDKRKYHRTIMLMPTVTSNGNKVKEIFHSHTDLHPLITSTDIAIFLLYGGDMDEFTVLSHGVYYRYNKQTNRIEIVNL